MDMIHIKQHEPIQKAFYHKKTKTGELFRNMVLFVKTLWFPSVIGNRSSRPRGGLALRVRGDLLPAGDGGAWMFSWGLAESARNAPNNPWKCSWHIYIELYNSYSNLKGSQRISKDLKGTLGLELARNLGWVELFSSRVAQLAAGSWS